MIKESYEFKGVEDAWEVAPKSFGRMKVALDCSINVLWNIFLKILIVKSSLSVFKYPLPISTPVSRWHFSRTPATRPFSSSGISCKKSLNCSSMRFVEWLAIKNICLPRIWLVLQPKLRPGRLQNSSFCKRSLIYFDRNYKINRKQKIFTEDWWPRKK